MAELEPADRVLRTDDEGLDRVADAFAAIIDAKSPYTRGHSARVATIAEAMAQRLGAGADRHRALRRAALLHDIGKLGVSNTILDKPGPLTDARVGGRAPPPGAHRSEILRRVLRRCAASRGPPAAHHERLDGSGYHRGAARRRAELQRPACSRSPTSTRRSPSTRPYQAAVEPHQALAVIGAQSPHALWTQGHRALSDAIAEARPEVAPPAENQD